VLEYCHETQKFTHLHLLFIYFQDILHVSMTDFVSESSQGIALKVVMVFAKIEHHAFERLRTEGISGRKMTSDNHSPLDHYRPSLALLLALLLPSVKSW
jgi:hypothetical protein